MTGGEAWALAWLKPCAFNGGLRLREDVFHFVENARAVRLVLDRRDSLQLLQQFALTLGELCGRLHAHFDEQIALSVTVQGRYSLITNLEGCARLSAFGYPQRLLAFERWNLNLCAKSGLSEGDRNRAVEIVALPFKKRMFLYV